MVRVLVPTGDNVRVRHVFHELFTHVGFNFDAESELVPVSERVRVDVRGVFGVHERTAVAGAIVVACHATPAVLAQHCAAIGDVTTIVLATTQGNRRAALRAPLILIVDVVRVVYAAHSFAIVEAHVELVADNHALRVAVGPLVAIRLIQALRVAVALNPFGIRRLRFGQPLSSLLL